MKLDSASRIRDLVYQITHSSVKAEAEVPLRELWSIYHSVEPSLTPYAKDKFQELISYSKTASGRSRDKAHWIEVTNQAFAKLDMAL